MKTPAEALAEILGYVRELESETVALSRSVGQAVAEDIRSDYDLPMLALCGPDGYAVRSEDIVGAGRENPVVLEILGSNRAGYLPKQNLRPGGAVRVMTGSPVPQGADCVVAFENTDEPGDKSGPGLGEPSHVAVFQAERSGANIRPAGSNVGKGSVVVSRGTCIGPAQISALTAIGVTTLQVIRRPRVAIISTGDELVRPGKPLQPGKVYDSNTPALAALVAHCGATAATYGIARDNERSLTEKLCKSLQDGRGTDAIVTSGGVSKGDYDLVRLVLDKIGRVVFSRVSMGPGASFAFGLAYRDTLEGRESVPVFAVGGPPVGCLVNFETLVRPALLKMMGCANPAPLTVDAVATGSISGGKPLDFVSWSYLNEVAGQNRVDLQLSEERGMMAAMAGANSFTIVPKGGQISEGDQVKVRPLDWTRW